jgi:hypothetical protein
MTMYEEGKLSKMITLMPPSKKPGLNCYPYSFRTIYAVYR